jgi:hypothetical protein
MLANEDTPGTFRARQQWPESLQRRNHSEVVDGRCCRHGCDDPGDGDDRVDPPAGELAHLPYHPLTICRQSQVDKNIGIVKVDTDDGFAATLE